MPRMRRLAGTTSLYALIAALLLVTPLSASEDSATVPVAPTATEPVAPTETTEQPQDVLPVPSEPAATVPEAAPPPPVEPPPPPEPAPAEQPPLPQPSPAPTEPVVKESAQAVTAKPKPRPPENRPRAVAAADTGVTISDFQFAPASVTIDVGDTVTWTNDGPTAHSATGDDGGFDTGIFEAGQSRSATFDQAGTFAYFCTPHPNMRGTITVRAASTGGGSGDTGGGSAGGGDDGGGGSGTTGTDSGASGDSSGSALPATGFDTGGLALLGLMTLALGALLRRGARAAE
jgi:plastocyanin